MKPSVLKDPSKYTNRLLGSDIEAKGYLDAVTLEEHVWCICSRDAETDEVFLFHDYPEYDNEVVLDDGVEYTIPERNGTLLDGVRFWYLAGKHGSTLSVHNLRTYDKPLIEKIYPQCVIPDEAWHDTFIQSKVQFFDRVQKRGSKSPHGLLNYSLMQGQKKPPVEDFSVMNAYMLHRCIVDTKTQVYCHKYLEQERKALGKLGIDLTEALLIENEYAENCHKQEMRGVKVDVPHMERCIKEWDERTEELANEIEPLLPPTIKVGSAKVTRSAMMKQLGFTRIPADEVVEVTKNGESVWQAKKPYFKPSTNFYKVEKVNNYFGFNISYGESPVFVKKNELTTWIKNNHPDTKSKDWDIQKEIKETKVLNAKTCQYFGVQPLDLDYVCGAHTKVTFLESKLTQHEVVKGYLIRYGGLKHCAEWNVKKDKDGQMVRAESFMTVSYPPKAAPEHQLHFKIKAREVIVTSPKVGEDEYVQITGDIGKKIGEYNTTMHRRRYLSNVKDPENKGVLSYVREDGRIPAGVNNFGTSTSRSTHRVIVNLPSESAPLGKEMRLSLIAPEDRVLVGADQASAQLQICSVVANNVEYYEAVAKGKEFKKVDGKDVYIGTSAHCVNARGFQLISREQWQEAIDKQDPELIHTLGLLRKKAKGPAFASLFGCAPPKLAGMLGIGVDEAKIKLKAFLEELGLTAVQEWLKLCQKKYKRGNGFYIPIAFGYWVFCKSAHAAVNYLIQGTEGAVQKIAVNYFERQVNTRFKKGNVFKVLDMHDEFLVECDPEDGEAVGVLMGESYTYAGKELHKWLNANTDKYSGGDKLLIEPDFNGGYAVGATYYDCH